MTIIKLFLSIAIAASICNSEILNISGVVIDSSGKGIAGAIIQLEKAKISAKSDVNGIFTLNGTVGIVQPQTCSPMAVGFGPITIQNSKIIFTLAVQSAIDVTVYGIQGQIVLRIKRSMDAGSQVLALPVAGDGLYICRIKIGTAEYLLKGTCLRRSFYGASKISEERPQETIAKQAAVTATIDDILSVAKDGFINNRIPVSESVMEMPPIKMIANAGNLIDIDGNVYQSVRIGGQVWTVENLRVTKYNNGFVIPLATDSAAWALCATTPAYCYYNNTTNPDRIKKYGALYNWYAVESGKLAPAGWHVPTDSEWTILEKYLVLNGYNWDGTRDTSNYNMNKIAKSLAAKTDWFTYTSIGTIGCDLTKNNSSGFSALPGGCRVYGTFYDQSYYGYWWSATVLDASYAWYCGLLYVFDYLRRTNLGSKCYGFSVRLLRDN